MSSKKQGGKKRSGALTNILLVLMLFVGLSLLLYPTVANWWNSMHQSRAVTHYVDTVAVLPDEEKLQMYQEAVAYNEKLAGEDFHLNLDGEEAEEYNSLLDISGTGIMGYVEIPKIKVQLPIYHGTDNAVLQIAIGHLDGTSLPVGGVGTHAVLSGHRGLPSAKLFSNLDQLREGDTFMIRTLDEVLTYEVDQILIVEPNQTEALHIDPEMDYCTLVTCTPYGVNTHRLLVRGHRVENGEDVDNVIVTADAMQIDGVIMAPVVAIPLLVILFVIAMITGKRS